jgi:hypothetical protein
MQTSSELSKSERRKLKKELKEAARIEANARLPEGVAKNNEDDDDDQRFTIGHQFYRDDLCTVKSMKISYLRKVFEGYKNISRCITEQEVFGLPMDVKGVTINNHYKKYISQLTPDTELNEFDAGDYRGFFFIDRSLKVVQMVAVDIHPEDKKQTK